jgi:hypothetical protein
MAGGGPEAARGGAKAPPAPRSQTGTPKISDRSPPLEETIVTKTFLTLFYFSLGNVFLIFHILNASFIQRTKRY